MNHGYTHVMNVLDVSLSLTNFEAIQIMGTSVPPPDNGKSWFVMRNSYCTCTIVYLVPGFWGWVKYYNSPSTIILFWPLALFSSAWLVVVCRGQLGSFAAHQAMFMLLHLLPWWDSCNSFSSRCRACWWVWSGEIWVWRSTWFAVSVATC